MKHRILYVIDELNSGGGGTEHHLKWLFRRIPDDGFEKFFIAISNRDQEDPKQWQNHVPMVLSDTCGHGLKSWPRRITTLARFIREHEIDLIQAFSQTAELITVLATVVARRGRVIGNRRNIGYSLNFKAKMFSRLSRPFRIQYIANSEAAKNATVKLEGIPAKRIEVISNPLFPERMAEGLENPVSREELNIPLDSPIVGMVATIRPIKGHNTFLDAVKLVLEKFPQTRFLLVGEQHNPDYLASLKEKTSRLGIENNVIWYGGIKNPFQILPHFTVAVLSSDSESFSNAVLEYSASGLPVVASDVGGMREIVVDRETGHLVPPGNPQKLAEKVIALLAAPEKRRTFGNAGKTFVLEHYAEEIILNRYLDFYTKVLGKERAL